MAKKNLLILALLVMGAFALLASRSEQAAYASEEDTITLTSPNNVTISESDDYATQALGDPWDMNNLDDLDWPHNYSQARVSNGIWNATTTAASGGSIHLQYQNFNNAYSFMGEKDGPNYPVDNSRFTRLWVRMYSAQAGQSLLWFFRHLTYTAAGNSNFFAVQPGWHIYSIDLRQGGSGGTGTWSQNGPYEGLRLDAPWGANNNNVQYDWIRLTPNTGQAVNIAWTYSGGATNRVNLYLSASSDANSGNEYLIANVPATDRAYNWTNTGVAPGRYYIHAEMNGAVSSSGALNVNTAPLVRIDAPSPLSGEDFGQAKFNAAWYGNNCDQFQNTSGVADLNCSSGVAQGRPINNDPQLLWLDRDYDHPIDTNRYRYMNVKFMVNPPAVRPWSPFNAGTRMTWTDGAGWQQTEFVLAPYNVWIPSAWDLRTVPLAGGTRGWIGLPHTFRFDVLEEDDAYSQPPALPAGFQIESAHLTSEPLSGPGTLIRWTAMQGGGMVDLYRDNDNVGYNGALIASNVPISQGSYSWDTSGLGNGRYYVYAVAHDAYNSSRFYSLVPLVVDHASVSTLFNDVPSNYWAVTDINRLAVLGAVSGTKQNDNTVLFNPAATAYRSHLSKMVVLAAGWNLENPSSPTFSDVAAGSTFYQFIETALTHGIISGYACGGPGEPCDGQNRRYFRPNNNVTRGQTAKMVSLSRGWPLITPGSATFADVPVGSSLFSYVETASQHSIISGYACGGPGEPCIGNKPYFRPNFSVTRAQLSKMLARALDSFEPEKSEK